VTGVKRAHVKLRLLPTEWAYIAGMIDGEGTVAIYKGQPRIQISQVDPRPIVWIHDRLGGSYRHWRHRYSWGVYSWHHVCDILEQVLPYLVLKQDRAQEVLDVYATHS
jgi:hypothetical protein